MYYSRMKYFIYDFIVLVFVVTIIFFGLRRMVDIKVRVSLVTITLAIVCLVYFIQLFNDVVFTGLRVIYDLGTENFNKREMIFIEQIPVGASVFSEKRVRSDDGKSIETIRRINYKIIVDDNGEKLVYTASKYLDLEKNRTYLFTIGLKSNIIVDVQSADDISIFE